MTLRRAIALFARPWINGNVTFEDWLLACSVIEAAIARDERQLSEWVTPAHGADQ